MRIVAGRPIHCQVPGIDHHLVRWAAVRATLEAAKAIAVSHLGTLFIAETDERRINRIQQVALSLRIQHGLFTAGEEALIVFCRAITSDGLNVIRIN